MRVVLVTGIYPPDHGGPARFVPQLAEACCERGWSVEVITLSENAVAADESRWTVTRIPRNIPKWRRLPLTVWRIMWALRRSDVLFANGLFEEASVASALARRPWVAKFVGDPVWERYRNSVPEPVSLEDFSLIQISRSLHFRHAATKWALRRAFCVITPSDQLASLLASWDVSDVRYIPNGVKVTPLSDLPPLVDVICVARLITLKNIDVLIRACAAHGLSLSIVGDGPEHDRLSSLVNSDRSIKSYRLLSRCSIPAKDVESQNRSRLVSSLYSQATRECPLLC
jgi:glycosyltransferase involved in cell wall biosynthesis